MIGEISILVCHDVFILTFCFIFIPIHRSFNPLLRRFDSFWLSFADKMTIEIYNFVSLIVKVILLKLASLFSLPFADKAQRLVYLSFNSTLHLINVLSSDLHKLLRYFNGTVVAVFFKIPFAHSGSVFSNNLDLYLKDLTALLSSMLVLKLFFSSLE